MALTKRTPKKAATTKAVAKTPAKPARKLTARNGGKPWKEVFIEAVAKTGNITLSAKKAKVSRTNVYQERENDREFCAQWDDALAEAGDLLEAEAERRAVRGVKKPIYQGGKLVGHIQEYSDTLLIFLLKGAKPEKFRERHEHSGPNGGAIPVALSDLIEKAYGDGDDSGTDKPGVAEAD